MHDVVVGFCSPRDLIELAHVNAGWRATSRIARMVEVMDDALRVDKYKPCLCAAEQIWKLPTDRVDPRDAPARCAAAFIIAGMNDLAQYFAGHLRNYEYDAVRVQLATYIRCDVSLIRQYNFLLGDGHIPYGGNYSMEYVIRIVALYNLAPADKIKTVMDAFSKDGGEFDPLEETIKTIIRSAEPCARMTDCLECIAINDIPGCLEYLPHIREDKLTTYNLTDTLMWTFAQEPALASCITIGPVLARALVEHYNAMHCIARQFSRWSQEFELYVEKLDDAIRTKWKRASGRKLSSRSFPFICANLWSAARNVDARVFEYVYERFASAGLIADINGTCDVRAWNGGERFEGLQRAVSRLESRMVKVSFDNDSFWKQFDIEALPDDEAVQCVGYVLERRPNVRMNTQVGRNARRALRAFANQFGKPMIALLARYHITFSKDE